MENGRCVFGSWHSRLLTSKDAGVGGSVEQVYGCGRVVSCVIHVRSKSLQLAQSNADSLDDSATVELVVRPTETDGRQKS